MSNCFFSVVVNNYNYSRYLVFAVESALSQDFDRDYEVLVVDDGSTDDSVSILRKRFQQRITIIEKENGGQASAYKAGIQRARGDYIVFLDADDYLSIDCLSVLFQFLAVDVASLHWRLQIVDEDGLVSGGVVPSGVMRNHDVAACLVEYLSYNVGPGSANCFRRDVVIKCLADVRLECFRFAADFIPIAAAPLAGRQVFINASLGFYRRHAQANASVDLSSTCSPRDDVALCLKIRAELIRESKRNRFCREQLRRNGIFCGRRHNPSRQKLTLFLFALDGRAMQLGKQLRRRDRLGFVMDILLWPGYTLLQKASFFVFAIGVKVKAFGINEFLARRLYGQSGRSPLVVKILSK